MSWLECSDDFYAAMFDIAYESFTPCLIDYMAMLYMGGEL